MRENILFVRRLRESSVEDRKPIADKITFGLPLRLLRTSIMPPENWTMKTA